MSDPKRLLDQATGFEAWVLLSAPDDPPPRDLLARTVEAVARGAPAAGFLATVAAAATPIKASGAIATSGGLLSAVAVGTIAGLVAVGGFEYAVSSSPPPPAMCSPAASSAIATPPVATGTAETPVVFSAEIKPLEAPAAPTTPRQAPRISVRHASSLASELALLDQAKAAIRRHDPARALALLDRYARDFPGGQLADDAALLRSDADAARAAGTTTQ